VASAAAAAPAASAAPSRPGLRDGIAAWQRGDYPAAVASWRPLADKGDPEAQYNLGQAYALGRGVDADPKRAQRLFAQAAARGNRMAETSLAIMLFQSGERAKAMPSIAKAATAGDPRAQYIYGTALFNGDLASKDWPRAYALMSRAAFAGLPQAASSLTTMDGYIPQPQRDAGLAMLATGADLGPASSPAPSAPATPEAKVASRESAAPPPPTVPPPPATTVAPREAAAPPPPNPPARPAAMTATREAVAPRAKPAPSKPRPTPGGHGWYVQLGAYSSHGAAAAAWSSVQRRVAALAALSPDFVQAGPLVRLRAGPVVNRSAASDLCKTAASAGQACVPAVQ
jgi:TPR repeat protein